MRPATRILLVLLTIGSCIGGAYRLSTTVSANALPHVAVASASFVAVEGTIRNAGAGWFVVRDGQHHPVNLSVDPGGRAIIVRYPRGERVLSMTASGNRELARLGIVVTTRVASDHATLRLTRLTGSGVRRLNAAAVHHAFGEIRILGYLEPTAVGTNS